MQSCNISQTHNNSDIFKTLERLIVIITLIFSNIAQRKLVVNYMLF